MRNCCIIFARGMSCKFHCKNLRKPLVFGVSKGVFATHVECHMSVLLSCCVCDGFVTSVEWEDYMLGLMDPCWGNHNILKTLEKRHKCVHNLLLWTKSVVLLPSSKVSVHAFWLVLGKCFYQGQLSSSEAHVKGWWKPWTLLFWYTNSIFCVTDAHMNCDYSECLQCICDQNIFSHRREAFSIGRSGGWSTRKNSISTFGFWAIKAGMLAGSSDIISHKLKKLQPKHLFLLMVRGQIFSVCGCEYLTLNSWCVSTDFNAYMEVHASHM